MTEIKENFQSAAILSCMFNPFSFLEDKDAVSVDVVKEAIDKNAPVRIIDVRMPEEYKEGHIAKSVLMPLSILSESVSKISETQKLYVYFRSGARSGQAVQLLKSLGYKDVHNVAGGLLAWRSKGYPLIQ